MPDFLWTSPQVPYPFADFALDPFTVTYLSYGDVYILSPVSPPGKSSNLEVVQGTPDTVFYSVVTVNINNSTVFIKGAKPRFAAHLETAMVQVLRIYKFQHFNFIPWPIFYLYYCLFICFWT